MFQESAESMQYNLAVHKIRSVDSSMETPFRKSLLGSLRVLWAPSRQSALIGCEFRRNVAETTLRLAVTKKRIAATGLNKIGIFILWISEIRLTRARVNRTLFELADAGIVVVFYFQPKLTRSTQNMLLHK